MNSPTQHTISRVFADNSRSEQFEKYGYVVVDLLTQHAVDALKDFYKANQQPAQSAFHTTHFSTDKDFKKKVHDAIASTLQPALKNVLTAYAPAFGNFMVKEAGGNNPMPMHADWTYVDERANTSISVWVPLTDTTIENGCLGVIPFSQHLSHHIRGPRILQWEYPCNELLIEKMGKLLPIKAGQAVIYNHRLLHFSPPNNSDETRLAVNLSLVPEGARVIHYTVPEGQEKIHKFEVDGFDFFIQYDNFQMPEKGKLVETIDISSVPLLNQRAEGFIKNFGRQNLVGRIRAMFNSFT
jgi:hypothetical protein